MKYFFTLAVAFLGIWGSAHAQDRTNKPSADSTPLYIKYPELPAFNILNKDSLSIFNTYNIPKGKPTLLVLFDPDCKHCKATAGELKDKMEQLKNIQMYWVTPNHDLGMIRNFYETFGFAEFPNIKMVGRDYEYFMAAYYGVKFIPGLVLYDERKRFVQIIDEQNAIKELLMYAEAYEKAHQK